MPVDRHRRAAQILRDAPHRKGIDALVFDYGSGRRDHLLT
jgi:hypothetical protein